MLTDSFRLISRNEYFDLLSRYNLFNQIIIDNEDLPFYSGYYIKYMIYECEDMASFPIVMKSNLGCTEVNYSDPSNSSDIANGIKDIISNIIVKDNRIPIIDVDDLANYINDLNIKVGKMSSFNINIDEVSSIVLKDSLYDFLSMSMSKKKILVILGNESIHIITKEAKLVIYNKRSLIPENLRIDINKIRDNLPNLIESFKIINGRYNK